MQWSEFFSSDEWWIARVFAVVFATVVLDFIAAWLLQRLKGRVLKTQTIWDDALLAAAGRPLRVVVWLLGLTFAAEIVRQQSHAGIFDLIEPLRRVGVVVIVTWFLVRAIKEAERNYSKMHAEDAHALDLTTLTALGNLGKISIIITGILVGLQSMGYSISGVLAFGGIGGIAIGFAAKDMLANLFGSLIIFMDRPFKIGDWIRSPDREIEGTVESIGWRMTVIRTFERRPLYVPNAVFSTVTLENPSRMTNRRIYETIGIRYDDFASMAAITREVREMLLNHPDIDTSRTLMVNFTRYGDSALDFFVYTFTKTIVWEEFNAVKQDVLLQIGEIIARHGAEIAFPTSTVHLQVYPASPAAA